MTSIETQRLILRPFTENDIQASFEMNLDPKVSKYTGDGGVLTYEELKKRITENVFGDYEKYKYGRMAVVLKSTNKFIGFSGLKYLPEHDMADLGYRYFSNYWGHGYATEAGLASVQYGFSDLKLNQITAFVLPENKASIRVLDKLGFSFKKKLIENKLLVSQYLLSK